MASDIIREFDPNIYLPEELKDAVVAAPSDNALPDPDPDYNEQFDTLDDFNSDLDEEMGDDDIEVPGDIVIVSQNVRTDPSGRQVVDIVIEFEDIPGAANYEIRLSTA